MKNHWDDIAEIRKYQIENHKDITFSKLFLPYFINIISSHHHDSILEIGCGTGHMAKHIIECTSPKVYIGIENSKKMFSISEITNSSNHATIIQESIFNYNSSHTYDIIISHLCLHVIDNIEMLFDKVLTLLNKNGIFIFSIPHPCFFNEYKNIFNNFEYRKIAKTFFNLSITNDTKKNATHTIYSSPSRILYKINIAEKLITN
ncbi:MAG: methyltransferase [Mailhella sp.]|nr:methyltransferase [Mailhella sp.]